MSSLDLVEVAASRAWDERRPPDPELIRACVHCGFCLTTCPSYAVFENEMDSPRGRVLLMRVGHEDDTEVSTQMRTHLDRCLGCMACVTACPSGVQYDRLIEQTRPQLERQAPLPWRERAFRRAVFGLFTHPGRMRALAPAMALESRVGAARRIAPRLREGRLRTIASLAPKVPALAALSRAPELTPARGARRGRVAFMQGCVQRVLFGDVNAATIRVLAAEGWEVHTRRTPRCCGALQLHSGVEEEALALARRTIEAYEGFDSVVVNAAGCGSAMKDYGHLLADDPAWAQRAAAFSAKVRDVHELLASDDEPRAPRNPLPLRVAYHDACHLAHAQRVREQPRALLRAIPELELLEPAEWELCCGSAGIYNLMQPEASATLGARKARNLAAVRPDVIAAANPGCVLQIAAHMPDPAPPILHPMTLLDASIRGTEVPR